MYTRSQRRHNNVRKAIRKRKMYPDYYDSLHQFSKNKVHCSCCMCRRKTNNKGFKHKHIWFPAMNWSVSDRKKLESMDEDYAEYIGGDVVA